MIGVAVEHGMPSNFLVPFMNLYMNESRIGGPPYFSSRLRGETYQGEEPPLVQLFPHRHQEGAYVLYFTTPRNGTLEKGYVTTMRREVRAKDGVEYLVGYFGMGCLLGYRNRWKDDRGPHLALYFATVKPAAR